MDILIVDDHQLFIDGMRHILGKLGPDMSITESSVAEQSIEILESGREFDLILLDLRMPGLDGLSVLKRMHAHGSWLPLVIVSAEEDLNVIDAALKLGALGFIPKTHSSKQMLAALSAVLDGEVYVPPTIQDRLDRHEHLASFAAGGDPGRTACKLTKRQHEVLALLAKGYSNKRIATSLFLTEHTVKAHVSALLSYFGASNRTECVRLAQDQGILGP